MTEDLNTRVVDPLAKEAHASGARLHALDGLRASALLVGVVFHSVLIDVAPPGEWAVGTQIPVLPLWWFVQYTHDFRMEVFFLLAGFFACLVIEKRGTAAFLRDRWNRIALVFGVLLYPVKLMVSIPWIQGGLKTGWLQLPPEVANLPLVQLAAGGFLLETWPDIALTHLWFLYYLAWISVLFVALRWILGKMVARRSAAVGAALDRRFFRLFSSRLIPLWIALLVTPVLALTERYTLDSPDSSFALDYRALLIYGFFFCAGWWLRRSAGLLNIFARRWKPYVALSLLAGCLAVYFEWQRAIGAGGPELRWMASLTNGLVLGLAVFGWTGFFVTFFSRESPVMRYLADSSYWVYITHLPIVITLQVWLSDWTAVTARLVIINAVTFTLTLLSYHWLVRYTGIGEWLNGRRHFRPAPGERSTPSDIPSASA